MKLSIFKGLAYDLADHLQFKCITGQLNDKIEFPFKKDILKGTTEFEKYCINFIKERIKKDFDFSRIKNINISIKRSAMLISTKVDITVDDKTFSNCTGSPQ